MKIITTFLFLTVFLSSAGFAQQNNFDFKRNVDIHINPIALGYLDPSVRIGSEYVGKGRWSYGLDLGAGFRAMYFNGIGLADRGLKGSYKLFEIRPEIKFYWLKRSYMGWYVSAEGMFMTRKNKFADKSFYIDDENQMHYDQATFTKTKIGGLAKIGVKFWLNDQFTLDFFSGLGLAHNTVKYTDLVNPEVKFYDPFFEMENFYPGKKSTAILSVGLKLGVLLWSQDRE